MHKRVHCRNHEAKRQRVQREPAAVKAECEELRIVPEDEEVPCVRLREAHPGRTDKLVVFIKEGHKYYFPWETEEQRRLLPSILSCTTFIHGFLGHFDKKAASEGKAAAGGYAEEGGVVEPEAIVRLWEYWGVRGTATHYLYELIGNEMPHQKHTWEAKLLRRFLWDHADFEWYWTERLVADVALRLGGSVDAVFRLRSRPNCFYIVDWKTCRSIMKRGIDKCFKRDGRCEPLPGQVCTRYCPHPITRHLENCNFTAYSLQLTLYRDLLERTEGLNIVGQALVVVNTRQLDYDMLETPYLKAELEEMFMERALTLATT